MVRELGFDFNEILGEGFEFLLVWEACSLR